MNEILREDYEKIILNRVTPRFRQLAGCKIYLSGAAGFIGSYLMGLFAYANEHYFDTACEVFGYDNMAAPSRVVQGPHCAMVNSDAVLSGCDYYLHLASIASPRLFLQAPLNTVYANVKMTESVLQRAGDAKAALHFSSCEVYGDPQVVPTPETYRGNVDFTAPRAAYDESKRLSETLCQIYYRQYKVPVKVVRPFNVFGPGENLNDGRVVPSLMKAVLDDVPFKVYGSGRSTRSFVYIADAVVQLLAVLLDGQPGEAYNIGDGDSELTVNELALEMQRLFSTLEIEHLPEARTEAEAVRRRPDVSKVLQLALPPATSLADGLRRTFAYYFQQRQEPVAVDSL